MSLNFNDFRVCLRIYLICLICLICLIRLIYACFHLYLVSQVSMPLKIIESKNRKKAMRLNVMSKMLNYRKRGQSLFFSPDLVSPSPSSMFQCRGTKYWNTWNTELLHISDWNRGRIGRRIGTVTPFSFSNCRLSNFLHCFLHSFACFRTFGIFQFFARL